MANTRNHNNNNN
jgi:hypothetical protein